MSGNRPTPAIQSKTLTLIVLAALVVAGFCLRVYCLGCLGFRWDEDLTSLAVKAVIQDGYPELPSGMIYLRSILYQYLMAASVAVLGFSEFSLRLPSALFGTMLIPAAYWFGQRLFSREVGLLAAAGIALSFWEVEMARTARMYAPFFLAYLGAAAAIYVCYMEDTRRRFHWLPITLALLALSLHQLAYSLAIIFLIPLFFSTGDRLRQLALCLQAALIGVAYLVWNNIQDANFYRGASQWPDVERIGGQVLGEAQASFPGAGIIALFDWPDLGLLQAVIQSGPFLPLVLVLLTGALIWLVARAAWRDSRLVALLSVAALLAAMLHQFNLSLLAGAAAAFACREGLRALHSPIIRLLMIAVGSLLGFWLVCISLMAGGMLPAPEELGGPRKLLRALADFPNFRLFWSFVLERPLLALPFLAGTAWTFHIAARPEPDRSGLFLLLALWAPVTTNAMLETKFEMFRYNLQLDTFYFCMAALAFLNWRPLIAAILNRGPSPSPPTAASPTGSVAAALLFLVLLNPLQTIASVGRDYQNTGILYDSLDLADYPDFRTTGEYVRAHLQPGDVIMTPDPREYYNYIGQVDYWIWSDNFESQTYARDGRAYDLYIAVPVIHQARDIVEAADGASRVWLVYSDHRVERTRWLDGEVKDLLNKVRSRTAYLGEDGSTRAVLLTEPVEQLNRALENGK